MKKLLILLVPILLFSCKKDKIVNDPNVLDSMMVKAPVNKIDSADKKDSMIANSKAVEKVLDEGVNRTVEQKTIVRTATGSMLPFTIGDEFTADNEKFILKIKNIDQDQLKISVDSKKDMNIRIIQIKKPDGTFDGPFGKTLNLKTPQKGEYWIMLGRNLMADGTGKGNFTIKVE